MKLENTPELLAAIEKSDALTAQLKELEAMKVEYEAAKTEHETAKKQLTEITGERDALETENKELKTAAAVVENVGEQIVAEVAENTELTEALTVKETELAAKQTEFETQLTAKDAEIAELKEKAEAFESLAVDYADEAETVQTQFELLGQHLGKKGIKPEITAAELVKEQEEETAHKEWVAKANSKDPAERMAARRMKKSDPKIGERIAKSAEVVTAPSVATTFTAEQMKIFTAWQTLLAEAKIAQQTKQSKLEAEKMVEARRFRTKEANKTAIDACLAAGLSA